MDKKHKFLLEYLIIPVCFLVAVIVVGLIRKHSLIEIYNDGLGITSLYYLLLSLFIYIRWEHLSNK
ncbi:ABC transporter [Peptacetobacter sp.]|uniref:ABC transporter n=1 Tax=Peptacetobacter sp. TaxID=2991975 RepID=UPI002E76C459|nr:ABC transporter [Peptacetobacter sp.]MEE0451068.1 ABC transporter [Peptacetobacter sp.]